MYLHAAEYHTRGFAPADLRKLVSPPPTVPLPRRILEWLRSVLL